MLSKNAGLAVRFSRTVPGDLALRAADSFDRVMGLRNAVMRAILDRQAMVEEIFNDRGAEANTTIKNAVAELKQFSADLASELSERNK